MMNAYIATLFMITQRWRSQRFGVSEARFLRLSLSQVCSLVSVCFFNVLFSTVELAEDRV